MSRDFFTELVEQRRLVARPQLLAQLNGAQSLTLVVASAGSGKTTLLSM